jgi:hypothetical protein
MSKKKRFPQMIYKFLCSLCFIISICVGIVSTTFAQTQWEKYQNNPVLVKDGSIPGCWQWAAIGQPTCLYENDTIKMWYAAAGIAYIGDPTPVLDVGAPGEWDSEWLDTPAILRDSSGYKLYYYGDSIYGTHEGTAIGVAMSTNGIDWEKYENNPILMRGDSTGWEGQHIESPAVLYDEGIYKMWYTGVAYDWYINIGYATSPDGKNWTKYWGNPVLRTGEPGSWDDVWVAVPAVRKIDNVFHIWYCGISFTDYEYDLKVDTLRIGHATSTNGIDWVESPENPLLSNFDPPRDSGGPWAPDVVFDGTEYKMFYETACSSGNWICMATAPISGIEQESDLPTNVSYKMEMKISPNPFSQTTEIRCEISGVGSQGTGVKNEISLKIYDLSGRLIKSFPVTDYSTGSDGQSPVTSVVWDGTNDLGEYVSSGLYFLCTQAGEYKSIRKLIKIR